MNAIVETPARLAWQEQCERCKHLLRSGVSGHLWQCAVVRRGGHPNFAFTARGSGGQCGPDARLFELQTRATP